MTKILSICYTLCVNEPFQEAKTQNLFDLHTDSYAKNEAGSKEKLIKPRGELITNMIITKTLKKSTKGTNSIQG